MPNDVARSRNHRRDDTDSGGNDVEEVDVILDVAVVAGPKESPSTTTDDRFDEIGSSRTMTRYFNH
jgi:hypothetical protein